MDPNSKNQMWSRWTYTVYPMALKRPNLATVKYNCAKFGKKVFQSASEMSVMCGLEKAKPGEKRRLFWEIDIRTEGHPVHDTAYVEYVHDLWRRFFREGFGQQCEINCKAKLEAGDRQDGKPADQLIIIPTIKIDPNVG